MNFPPGYLVSTYLGARMPPLGRAFSPALCPICNSRRVPPESDGGLPPPEQWVYICGGAYALPEDDAAPGAWEPYDFCGQVGTEQALAWVRDGCCNDPRFASLRSVLERAVQVAPPYRAEGGSPLLLHLAKIDEKHTPGHCPICGAEGRRTPGGFNDYDCGAQYVVVSEWPGEVRVPRSWGPLNPCGRPPVSMVLLALRARNEIQWKSICEEALAALP